MASPEEKLEALGLTLPQPVSVPEGLHLPFAFVNVRGNRALISGHPRQGPNGDITGPYGFVGADLTTEEAPATTISSQSVATSETGAVAALSSAQTMNSTAQLENTNEDSNNSSASRAEPGLVQQFQSSRHPERFPDGDTPPAQKSPRHIEACFFLVVCPTPGDEHHMNQTDGGVHTPRRRRACHRA